MRHLGKWARGFWERFCFSDARFVGAALLPFLPWPKSWHLGMWQLFCNHEATYLWTCTQGDMLRMLAQKERAWALTALLNSCPPRDFLSEIKKWLYCWKFFFNFIQRHSVERRKRQKFRGGSLENCMPLGATERKQTEGFCEQKESQRDLWVQMENGWLRTDMKKFGMLACGFRVYFAGDEERSLEIFLNHIDHKLDVIEFAKLCPWNIYFSSKEKKAMN